MTITLSSDRIQLTLEPRFGARVTSLTDRRSGRQWLVLGSCQGAAGDQASYGGAEARGWDECFPSIASGSDAVWGKLRDHGQLWGRPWQVAADPGAGHCTTTYRTATFAFERGLALQGPVLTASYSVTNHAPKPLPYLWSQHALLATNPADRLSLIGIPDLISGASRYIWPHHPARDLTLVGPLDEGFAQKSYAATPTGGSAAVCGPDGGLRFDWSGDLPAFGLWLDYGGWPPDAPVHQIAFEPATAMADSLADATALGQIRRLAPGATDRWAVRLTVMDPGDHQPFGGGT